MTILADDESLDVSEMREKMRALRELLEQMNAHIKRLAGWLKDRDNTIDEQEIAINWLQEQLEKSEYFKESAINVLEEQAERTDCEQESDDSAVVPMELVLVQDKAFDKQVLSFGRNGKLQDSHIDLERIRRSFPDEDAQSNFHEYANQFVPHIMEDLRCTVVESLEKIEKKAEKPFTATVNTIKHQEGQAVGNKKKKHSKFQRDFSSVTLSCTAPLKAFPELDHGFNKELICVVLPSHNRSTKKLNFVLAIGGTDRDGENIDSTADGSQGHKSKTHVSFTVQLLGHDFSLLRDHTYNVEGSETVTRLKWYWLAGLIPAQRMHEACAHRSYKPPFYRQYFSMQTKAWPQSEPNEPSIRKGLNDVQSSVVNRLLATDEPGMYSLIGPPGTGKTTTIVTLLLERVKKFPGEKILLTAPSNKAVQVVLQKLLANRPATDMPAIALVGAKVPDELKPYCPAMYTALLCAPFRKTRAEKSKFPKRRTAFLAALDAAIGHHCKILLEVGLPVLDEGGQALQSQRDATALTDELERLRAVAESTADIDALEDCMTQCISAVMSKTDAMEEYLLRKAQIVFCTLISSGRKNLHKILQKFDTVILDEASQALIPATIIPFKFQPQLFVLVGDPQQLPATVQSHKARQLGYGDSMMLVMDDHHRGNPSWAQMLTTQYRMHPAICKWTSDRFYGGRLHPAESVSLRVSPLDRLPTSFPLRIVPSAFVTMHSTELKQEDGSKSNTIEADVVVAVAKYLLDNAIKPAQIGIIAFYAGQVQILKEKLTEAGVNMEGLAVSTVDGFQGDEKDFILVSCVRTCPSAGFLKDHRRINVALSRAKHARWVFGDAAKLGNSNSALRDFLGWIADTDCNSSAPATQVVQGTDLISHLHSTAPAAVHTAIHRGATTASAAKGSRQPAATPSNNWRGNSRGAQLESSRRSWETAAPGPQHSKKRILH